jgi:hypothetical protein
MIQRVVFSKLQAGQLDQSGLTIEDVRVLTSRMASTLVNMYHGRIKYPWQREESLKALGPAPKPDGGAPETTRSPRVPTPGPEGPATEPGAAVSESRSRAE